MQEYDYDMSGDKPSIFPIIVVILIAVLGVGAGFLIYHLVT